MLKCDKCGYQEKNVTKTICSNCGDSLVEERQEMDKKLNFRNKFLLPIVFLLIICGLSAFFFMKANEVREYHGNEKLEMGNGELEVSVKSDEGDVKLESDNLVLSGEVEEELKIDRVFTGDDFSLTGVLDEEVVELTLDEKLDQLKEDFESLYGIAKKNDEEIIGKRIYSAYMKIGTYQESDLNDEQMEKVLSLYTKNYNEIKEEMQNYLQEGEDFKVGDELVIEGKLERFVYSPLIRSEDRIKYNKQYLYLRKGKQAFPEYDGKVILHAEVIEFYDDKPVIFVSKIQKLAAAKIDVVIDVDTKAGEAPLVVNFDASESTTDDETNAILFYKWEFGDGIKETTESPITKNIYDKPGLYEAKLTVVTKNEEEKMSSIMISALTPVEEIKINLDSHPTGVAWQDDIVKMSIDTEKEVKYVEWEFGDIAKAECEEGNEDCIVEHKYTEPGNYKITARVYFQGEVAPVVAKKVIRVKEK